jgi:hypothetical protein
MAKNKIIKIDDIKDKIITIRNTQVMLDSDLAGFYGVDTKRLNEQVKRNKDRFPIDFCFRLNESEFNLLRSQNATSEGNSKSLRSQNATSKGKGGRRYLPYVFTEQGVAMLSAVLKSDTAVKMSIQIMSAFVAMRHFLIENAQIFGRLDSLEFKQMETDKKLDTVLDALGHKELQPKQGIFFEGQIFDAYKFACDLIRKASKSIVLIDNYIDETVLDIFTKRNKKVTVTIYTKSISAQLKLDLKKHNEQYPAIEIKEFKKAHDRFLIIDDKTVFHIGASLKDLGKKWFAFSKMDINAINVLSKLL